MGCFSSSERPEAVDWENIPWTAEDLPVLDAAINLHLVKLQRMKARHAGGPRYWSMMKITMTLMRSYAALTKQTSSLDQARHILGVFSTSDGVGLPAEIYLWALLTHGEVLYERFEISKEAENLDTSITMFLRYAEVSQSTSLDICVPVARAMKALAESRKPPETKLHAYIIDDIWPNLSNTKIGPAVVRYLGFFWKLEYMQTGSFDALMACISATSAADCIYRITDDEAIECNAQDLVKLIMIMYFHPHKEQDLSEMAMPEWALEENKKAKKDLTLTPDNSRDISTLAAIYQPLQNREIRIVEIESGEFGSEICCRVSVVCLDNNPVFEAISYAEENDKEEQLMLESITVNGQLLTVSGELHHALSLVRSNTSPRIVWIDGLCIDQENLREKSSQVAMRKDIYTQAERVLMCIEDPVDQSTEPDLARFFPNDQPQEQDYICAVMARDPRNPIRQVIDWTDLSRIQDFFFAALSPTEWPVLGALSIIFCLATGNHLGDMPFFLTPNDPDHHQYYAWRKSALALQTVFAHSYWKQAWILHDIAVAKEAVVYYGNHIMPFKYFVDAQQNLMQHSMTCCSEYAVNIPHASDIFPGWHFILSGFLSLMQPVQNRIVHSKHKQGAPTSLSFRNAMVNAHLPREATDLQDLVFSAIGLVIDPRPTSISIDYSYSIARVWANATLKIFQDDQNLSALEFHDYGRKSPDPLTLPSWVPDWRFSLQTEALKGSRLTCSRLNYASFSASKDRKFNGRLEGDLCLSLQSTKIDAIAIVGEYYNPTYPMERDYDSPHPIQPAESVKTQLTQWRAIAKLPAELPFGELSKSECAFWRTVFADTMCENVPTTYRKMKFRDFASIQEFLDLFSKSISKDYISLFKVQGPNLGSYNRATLSRRFFVTEGGRFGLGCASEGVKVEVGDEVHAVEGSNMPRCLEEGWCGGEEG